MESWYAGYGMPSRIISVSKNGITYQEDYTYNERRQELTLNAVGSDGSVGRQEPQYDEEGEILSYSSYVYVNNQYWKWNQNSQYRRQGKYLCFHHDI